MITPQKHGHYILSPYFAFCVTTEQLLQHCRIRMNFLDHLDEWIEQAMDRASSVVAAKVICFLLWLYFALV